MSVEQPLNTILPAIWRKLFAQLRSRYQLFLFIFVCMTASGRLIAAQQLTRLEDLKDMRVYVSQSITASKDAIEVRIVFENRSETPVLIKEGVFGVAVRELPKKMYEMAEQEFIVYNNGQELDYVGPIVMKGPYVRDNFIEFGPGEISVRRVNIRQGFKFLHGRHEYKLVHRHLELDPLTGVYVEKRSEPVNFELHLP